MMPSITKEGLDRMITRIGTVSPSIRISQWFKSFDICISTMETPELSNDILIMSSNVVAVWGVSLAISSLKSLIAVYQSGTEQVKRV